MQGVKVTVSLGGVKQKLSASNFNRGRYAMADQMVSDMTQFVPKKESSLRITGHASADGSELIWDTPYAKAQFHGSNGKASWTKGKTPGTGPRWDLKAKSMFMPMWKKAFKDGTGL